jgi:hypothetical protein
MDIRWCCAFALVKALIFAAIPSVPARTSAASGLLPGHQERKGFSLG